MAIISLAQEDQLVLLPQPPAYDCGRAEGDQDTAKVRKALTSPRGC